MSRQSNILKAAIALYTRQGIRFVTVDELARSLGMSKRTIYTYFDDKAELVDCLYGGLLQQLEKKLLHTQEESDNPVVAMIRIYRAVLSAHAHFPRRVVDDLRRIYSSTYDKLRSFHSEFLPTLLSYNIASGINAKLYHDRFDCDIMAELVINQLNYLWRKPEGISHAMLPARTRQQFLQHLMRGLTTHTGKSIASDYFSGRSYESLNLINTETE